MKHIIIFSLLALLTFVGGCNSDFLDKAPGVDLTEDDIFKNKNNFENNFIPTIYAYAVHSMFMYPATPSMSYTSTVSDWNMMLPTSTATDEGEETDADYQAGSQWNTGNVLPTNIHHVQDTRYFIRWIALRYINIALKRIDEIPDADEAYKNQIKGEMHTLRAMNYFEMIKRYGGVPIVTEVFEPSKTVDKPRNNFEECIDFIVDECNLAIANNNLPPEHISTQKGRVTKLVAYTVKSYALLYAASPLFNTASPYLRFNNLENNKLIGYGNYDQNRWELAVDATRQALDYALTNGYGLIDEVANRDPDDKLFTGVLPPRGNYRYAWETHNNKEIILAFQIINTTTNHGRPGNNLMPSVYTGWTNGNSTPLNFFRKYEKKDGTPQTWESEGGTDLIAKFSELDPRFKQTINFTGSYYNNGFLVSEIYNGGPHYKNCLGGVWMRKYTPYNSNNVSFVLHDPIYRVNVLYLNLAEALNEFHASPPTEAYTAVNTIRLRSAMPDFPAGMTKDEFREKLRNERAIELCYDDHRFYDIRRWMIAEEEGVMRGNFYGIQIEKTGDKMFSWKPYIFEKRTFFKRMYLNPFPQSEFLKGNLVQNPGY